MAVAASGGMVKAWSRPTMPKMRVVLVGTAGGQGYATALIDGQAPGRQQSADPAGVAFVQAGQIQDQSLACGTGEGVHGLAWFGAVSWLCLCP